MRPLMRPVGGTLLGLVILYAIARLSLAEYAPESHVGAPDLATSNAQSDAGMGAATTALLRLSWRTRGDPVHACRRLSAEELEALPIHMRREEVCETRVVPWLLHLELDGRTMINDTILPAGARQDRPLYVFRDFPLPPGRYDFAVRFEQIGVEQQEADDSRLAAGGTPQTLGRSGTLELTSGEIALITYDPDSRSLVVRQPVPRDSTASPDETEPPEASL